MASRVTIKLNNSNVNVLVEAQRRALELTANEVLSDIRDSAVVPKQSGELERSGFPDLSNIKNLVATIIFNTPYARRLYFHPEYNFRHDKNINAQGLWMQSYIDGDKKDYIRETYAKFLKECSKGLIK